MLYEHVVNGKAFAADDAQWLRARVLLIFVNPNDNAHANGGVHYGLLLNSRRRDGLRQRRRSRGTCKCATCIHDLEVAPIEKLKFKKTSVGGSAHADPTLFSSICVKDLAGIASPRG